MNEGLREIAEGAFQGSEDVFKFLGRFDDLQIDVLITDPPYSLPQGGSFVEYASGKTWREREGMYQAIKEPNMIDWLKVCYSKMAQNSALFVMTNRAHRAQLVDEIERAGFTFKNELVWVKCTGFDQGMALGQNFLNGVEYIIYAQKGDLGKVNTKMNVFVKPSPRRGRNSKPEELYAHCLEPIIKKVHGAVVVDPFAGSDPLTRAKMRGLIRDCKTFSNVLATGDETDPAHHGTLLKTQNLAKWF